MKMSADEKMKKQIVPSVAPSAGDGFDGFTDRREGSDGDDRVGDSVIQGQLVKFTNEAKWLLRSGEEVPPELEPIAVDVLRIFQKWINQAPVETRVLGAGEPVPDLEVLNEAAPKSEWRYYNNKHIGPWQFQYIVYLLDPNTMDRYTYATGTTGGGICVRDLVQKVKWMRTFRGAQVCPIVALSDVFMNTQFGGRQRPHLIVKRWIQFGGDKPALPAPSTPTPHSTTTAQPLPGMKTVEEPSLKEQMNDELPFDDSPDLNVPKAAAPFERNVAKGLAEPKKPPASSKPTITKRGVQKIAAGRGR
jgi:hypothetical protein